MSAGLQVRISQAETVTSCLIVSSRLRLARMGWRRQLGQHCLVLGQARIPIDLSDYGTGKSERQGKERRQGSDRASESSPQALG